MACSFFNVLRFFWLVICIFAVVVKPDEDPDDSKISMCELSLAQLLLLPPDSMQVQALKRELFRYLEEKLEEDELSKRSFASLVRDGNLPYVPKRSIEALARSGYLKSATDDFTDDDVKRSIANLAKNGQLPTFQRPEDEQTQTKRGIESLARNGDLHGKRKLENLFDNLYGKRNIASLARGFNYPVAGKRYIGALARGGDLRYSSSDDDFDKRNIASIVRNGKRNVQSLVRTNNLPGGKRYYLFDELKRNIASLARTMGSRYTGKRAVPTAALLRQDGLMKPADHHHYDDDSSKSSDNDGGRHENDSTDKRNIAALKAQMKSSKYKRSTQNENETSSTRSKRQADYWDPSEEYPVPVYQNNNVFDYEELIHSLTGEYPNQEKRFLGSVARQGGWYRSPSRFRPPSKRHIGALARLGWLPAFRTARRFNRSGRSANAPVLTEYIDDNVRSYPADGSAEIDTQLSEEPLDEAAKRYLLLPAIDNILLRKLYSNTQNSNQDLL